MTRVSAACKHVSCIVHFLTATPYTTRAHIAARAGGESGCVQQGLYTAAMFEVRCVVSTPKDIQGPLAIYEILVSRSVLRRLSTSGSSPTSCSPPIHEWEGSSSSLQGGGALSTRVVRGTEGARALVATPGGEHSESRQLLCAWTAWMKGLCATTVERRYWTPSTQSGCRSIRCLAGDRYTPGLVRSATPASIRSPVRLSKGCSHIG